MLEHTNQKQVRHATIIQLNFEILRFKGAETANDQVRSERKNTFLLHTKYFFSYLH